jgi:hypothetical protein
MDNNPGLRFIHIFQYQLLRCWQSTLHRINRSSHTANISISSNLHRDCERTDLNAARQHLRYWRMDPGATHLLLHSRARYSFCPECIAEMVQLVGFAWVRSDWIWAPLTHCLSHGVPLWERCPVCHTDDPLLFVAPGTLSRAGSCRNCTFYLMDVKSSTTTSLNRRVKDCESLLFAIARGLAMPFPRTQSSKVFLRHAVIAVEELMQEVDGIRLFVAMADQRVECNGYLRGRRVPEEKLAFLSWSWRLLLGNGLAELLLDKTGMSSPR